jgi:hypothetical protein
MTTSLLQNNKAPETKWELPKPPRPGRGTFTIPSIVKALSRLNVTSPDCFGGQNTMITIQQLYVDPRSAEANRQISRIFPMIGVEDDWDGEGAKAPDRESLVAAGNLISLLCQAKMPIPIASVGHEGNSSLFIEAENFYGDLEIFGKSLEYLITSEREGVTKEIMDSEEIHDGAIPPRLLQVLFDHFGGLNANL